MLPTPLVVRTPTPTGFTVAWLLIHNCFTCFIDLLSDFVTLYTFKMSRRPPDAIYPYGYGKWDSKVYNIHFTHSKRKGKYETMGSIAVSAFLLVGGAGIGIHSAELLLAAMHLSDAVAANPDAVTTSTAVASSMLEGHHHHGSNVLDPNAAWFALISVVIKEWLYRASKLMKHSVSTAVSLTILFVSLQGRKGRAQ